MVDDVRLTDNDNIDEHVVWDWGRVIFQGDLAAMEKCIMRGAPINQTVMSPFGTVFRTALFAVAMWPPTCDDEACDKIQLLLQHRANVCITDRNGFKPSDYCGRGSSGKKMALLSTYR